MSLTITITPNTLLVLCGPAGAGKSTFATRHFSATSIVSSDRCRALITDDENNQLASSDAFDLLFFIINKRLLYKRFTVVDSTALLAETRLRLKEMANKHRYHTCLVIFNMSVETCVEHDQQRSRNVGEAVIQYHSGQLQRVLHDAPLEGWDQLLVLNEGDVEKLRIVPHTE